MRRVIIALLVFGLGSVGYWYYRQHRAESGTQGELAVPEVSVASVVARDIPIKLSAIGSLATLNRVAISSPVAGKLSKIYFKNGDMVAAGQALFQLDDTLLKAYLESANAALRYDQARLKRYKTLQKAGGGASLNEIDEIQSSLKQNAATVAIKKAQLQQATIRAPFAGQLENRQYSVGAFVEAGAALVKLVDLNHITVNYAVPGQLIAKLKTGQGVQVVSNGYPGKVFNGKVTYVAPTVVAESNTINVSATIDNAQHLLHPGMFVEIEQRLGQRHHVLTIPEQSLLPSIAGLSVFVVKDGKVQRRPIKTGVRTAQAVEVTQGLHAGELVVIAGQQNLHEGMTVGLSSMLRRSQ